MRLTDRLTLYVHAHGVKQQKKGGGGECTQNNINKTKWRNLFPELLQELAGKKRHGGDSCQQEEIFC